MKVLIILLTLCTTLCSAQTYHEEITAFRNNYVAEHLKEEHSPIKYQQVKNLQFYKVNETYKVLAQVKFLNDNKGFTMLTHTGKKKTYYRYAKLTFSLDNKKQVLYLYQSKALIQKKEYRDYLFLPFTDNTNYSGTFGGGRYIDFILDDIKEGTLVIDFNKSYNPYCAYAGGYNCPIPPKENDMNIAILAGEKLPANMTTPH